MNIAPVSETREMDAAAVRECGVSEALLMENAARGACTVLDNEYDVCSSCFAVLCGTGNNGGDGLAPA